MGDARATTCLLVIMLCLGTVSCSRTAKRFPPYPVREDSTADQLQAAKDAYEWAADAKTRGDQMGLARKGMQFAERCSELDPRNAPCHFYNALNTGMYYEAKVVGYEKGMARIVSEAEHAAKLDPAYEEGGAYRILGRLYLKAPSFSLSDDAVTRDLDKSRDFLSRAVEIAPHYPENRLFLAETLVELEEAEAAQEQLNMARESLEKNHFEDDDIEEWQKLMMNLEKKLGD